MSERIELDPNIERSVLDMYKSLTPNRRSEEEELLTLSISEGVVPSSLRYGIMNQTRRGVVKSTDGTLYYMSYAPGHEFRLIKADTPRKKWESENLLKNCNLGCDLIKAGAEYHDDEKEEELDKAEGGAGQQVASRPMPVEEEQQIADQHDVMTTHHPGAAGALTPDQPNRGKDWHGTQQQQVPTQPVPDAPVEKGGFWDMNTLLKGLGQSMQKSVPPRYRQPSHQEHQFMVEVLGRSPEDIAGGNASMSPGQRVQFNQWLNKSLRYSLNGLQGWRNKNGA